MAKLDKLITLDGLQVFGEGTIVPILGAISLLSLSLEGLSNVVVSSEAGAFGLRYYNGNFQYATYTYDAVTPQAGDDPSAEMWYVLVQGEYVLSKDTSVVAGTTYYERITTWNTINIDSNLYQAFCDNHFHAPLTDDDGDIIVDDDNNQIEGEWSFLIA